MIELRRSDGQGSRGFLPNLNWLGVARLTCPSGSVIGFLENRIWSQNIARTTEDRARLPCLLFPSSSPLFSWMQWRPTAVSPWAQGWSSWSRRGARTFSRKMEVVRLLG